MGRRQPKDDPNWKPSIPNPRIFQLPNTVPHVPITIKAPQLRSDDDFPPLPSIKATLLAAEREPHVRVANAAPALSWESSHGEKRATKSSHDAEKGTEVIAEPYDNFNPQGSARLMTWRPDIYVQAFVPRAYLEVNNAPAIPISSRGVDGIDFATYVSNFASPLFLAPQYVPKKLPSLSGLPLLPIDQLGPQNFERHFMDCVMLDLEAQRPEVRSYDLFGCRLNPIDPSHQIFDLHVPGLRENAPNVVYGDIVLLRQLLPDPATTLPRGMDRWLSGGGRERGEPCPGFTGYEITATVTAVDKRAESLHLRVDGVGSMPIICNISFVVQGSRVKRLQHTISDIAHELQGARGSDSTLLRNQIDPTQDEYIPRKDQNKWLERMLFPKIGDGVLQKTLPSGTFRQEWYDENLNYEQMKAVSAIQSRTYGSICYIINGPPGTGKTKTIVESVTQLANDSDFVGTILLCAPSDPAADTLALRLKAFFGPDALLRLNEFSRTFAEVPQELLSYCHVENNIFNLPPFKLLMSYKIVITTCKGAGILIQARVTNRDLVSLVQNTIYTIDQSSRSLQETHLHWAGLFVDEAAQATEPELLIPLAVVAPKTGVEYRPDPIFVMAGDQFQLGPRIFDRNTNLKVSLLERLSERPIYASHVSARRNRSMKNSSHTPVLRPAFTDLVRNYRSHPAILAVPSSLFYHNTLIPEATQTDSLLSWTGWQGRGWPVLFSCNGGIDDCEDVRTTGGAGWYNSREAHKAIDYAQDLLTSQDLKAAEICIMSPFRSQVNMLRQIARSRGLWGLNIGPMEAFQGLESRIVLICTTRARSRFLAEDALRGVGMINEPKKFNVALTRAKEGLIVLGNPWLLSLDPCWLAFLKFCWRNGLWELDKEGRDPRMPDGDEAYVDTWVPPQRAGEDGKDKTVGNEVQGLEAALIYREIEQKRPEVRDGVRRSVRRFMGRSQDDEFWMSGVEAMEALRVSEQDGEGEIGREELEDVEEGYGEHEGE